MLHPYLLWFLPLVLVPILLHLLSLRRLKTVALSTFRFLMDSYVQQRRNVKLLEFLLMALRTLFVLLLILALSRPMVERFGFLFKDQGSHSVILLLDVGASMALRSGATTSFERARAAACAIVKRLGKEVHVTIIEAGRQPRVVDQRFAGQPEAMIESIQDLQPGSATSDIGAALATALSTPRHGARVVCIFTDGNRKAWSTVRGNPGLAKLSRDDRLVVMNVGGPASIENLAVVGNPPPPLQPIVGLPVILNATVVNSAGPRTVETALTVTVDNEQIGRFNLSLRPGEQVSREISFTPSHAGIIQGNFQLPPDAFTEDDSFLFCLNVQPKLNVVVIAPPADTGRNRSDLFVRAALEAPLKSTRDLTPADQQIAQALTITPLADNAVNDEKLQPADLAIVADAILTADSLLALRRYVENGGGLILFPGVRTIPDPLCEALFRGTAGSTNLPVVRLAAAVGDPDDESAFLPVSGLNLAHPVLSAFDGKDADYFSTMRVYRHFPIELLKEQEPTGNGVGTDSATTAGPTPSVLMRLPDGSPLMIEAQIGRGRVLLSGIPATPDWSNLPLKPEFVPILLRSVAYLRRPAPADATPSVRPGRPAIIRINELWSDARVQAVEPDGKSHTVVLHPSGSRRVGALTDTGQKGYYRFQIAPRTAGAPERIELGFAVNLDVADADIAGEDESGIRAALSPAQAMYLKGEPDDPLLTAELTQRHEIWRSLIWVMFVVIGVEFVLSTLRARRARTQNGVAAGARRWLANVVNEGTIGP